MQIFYWSFPQALKREIVASINVHVLFFNEDCEKTAVAEIFKVNRPLIYILLYETLNKKTQLSNHKKIKKVWYWKNITKKLFISSEAF